MIVIIVISKFVIHRKTKKKLTKVPVKRKSIKTVSKYDSEKRSHKRYKNNKVALFL